MRTTITLDEDVAAAVEQLRRRRRIGISEAVNELIRSCPRLKTPRSPFQQRTRHLGLRLDVRNVAEALELLEGSTAR